MEDSESAQVAIAEYQECDYEVNCTPLYKAIENAIVNENNNDEQYDHISEFLETGQWPAKSDFSNDDVEQKSAQLQAKTWVTRFQATAEASTTPRNKIEWSQLPLHLAIVGGAPSNIIGGLVKLYPMGLRCTDDQQMLPLHLALRHGAEDEIVAYLLMQFPDAVNAKGKHGRTPVDCALRARDKVRGIIVETFVEKTKASIVAGYQREKAVLQGSLDVARQQWDDVSSKLQIKEAALAALEEEHRQLVKDFESTKAVTQTSMGQTQTLLEEVYKEKKEMETTLNDKIAKLESEKLTESIEFQTLIETLQEEKAELEKTVARVKEEESILFQELGDVRKQLASAVTPEDFNKLKEEAGLTETYQMSRTMSQTRAGIKDLLQTVKKNEQSKDPEVKSEIKTIKKTFKELEKSEPSEQTTKEMETLKAEVERLRDELKHRHDSTRTKLEVAILKKSLEAELRNTQNMTTDQVAALQRAVEAASPSAVETKMGAELAALKTEMESLRLNLKENELALKAKQNAEALEESLDSAIKKTKDATMKKDLQSMKKIAEGLSIQLRTPKSKNDILQVSKEVAELKEFLQKKEAAAKIKSEAKKVLKIVDATMEQSKGMSQQLELVDLKRNVSKLMVPLSDNDDLEQQEVDDLYEFRSKLKGYWKDVKAIESATKTLIDLKVLKEVIDNELHKCSDKNQKELAEVTASIDAVNLDPMQSQILKDTLHAAINKSNKKTEKELVSMKKAVGEINTAVHNSHDTVEWGSIQAQVAKLKVELKHRNEGKMDEELQVVKAALEQISADHDKKVDSKYQDLRDELNCDLRVNKHEAPVPVPEAPASPRMGTKSPKQKGGLRKFFSRRFSRKASKKQAEDFEEVKVPTILPPSGTTMTNARDAARGYAEISSGEEDLPPAVKTVLSKDLKKADTKEMEVTLELHRTLSKSFNRPGLVGEDSDSDDDEYDKERVNGDRVKTLPTFNRTMSKPASAMRPPSAMRKVKSMDLRRSPGSSKSVQIDPYEIVRTWSKSVIRAAQSEEQEGY